MTGVAVEPDDEALAIAGVAPLGEGGGASLSAIVLPYTCSAPASGLGAA